MSGPRLQMFPAGDRAGFLRRFNLIGEDNLPEEQGAR